MGAAWIEADKSRLQVKTVCSKEIGRCSSWELKTAVPNTMPEKKNFNSKCMVV